jgi:beta-phosphoglucomutase
MKKIKAIIFDMDGVLIDAKEWHYKSLNRALKLFGIEISRYDHLITFDGLPTRKKLEMLSIERGLPKMLHEFINNLKQQYTMEMTHQMCHPVFYHQYALTRLSKDGYRLAVCSNSIRDTIKVMLNKSGLLQFLEFYLSNQDVVNPKPDPEIYNMAIKKLGMDPTDCLILEDNENGIQSAKNSGAFVVEVDAVSEVNYANIISKIKIIEDRC